MPAVGGSCCGAGRGWRGAIWPARTAVRAAFLGALLYALYRGEGTASYLYAVEPFGALQLLLSAGLVTGSLLAALALALLAGAAFCGWVCPLGSVLWHLPRGSRSLPTLPKYELLAVAVATSLLLRAPAFCSFCPAGALYGSLAVPRPGLLPVLVVALLALGLWRWGGNAWCKSLCPLKASLSLLGRWRLVRVAVDRERCTRCGRCERLCRVDAIDPATGAVSDECVLCGDCLAACPAGAARLRVGWAEAGPAGPRRP